MENSLVGMSDPMWGSSQPRGVSLCCRSVVAGVVEERPDIVYVAQVRKVRTETDFRFLSMVGRYSGTPQEVNVVYRDIETLRVSVWMTEEGAISSHEVSLRLLLNQKALGPSISFGNMSLDYYQNKTMNLRDYVSGGFTRHFACEGYRSITTMDVSGPELLRSVDLSSVGPLSYGDSISTVSTVTGEVVSRGRGEGPERVVVVVNDVLEEEDGLGYDAFS